MKKSMLFLLCVSTLGLMGGCNDNSSVSEISSSLEEVIKPEITYYEKQAVENGGLNNQNLANNVQDGMILHAWNWSYNTIKEKPLLGDDIMNYTPLQIKQAVVGYGRADKIQVQKMVKTILGVEKLPKLDDTTDSMAAAICHAHSAKFSQKL